MSYYVSVRDEDTGETWFLYRSIYSGLELIDMIFTAFKTRLHARIAIHRYLIKRRGYPYGYNRRSNLKIARVDKKVLKINEWK